ncbi:MAG: DUF1893 domain-containing protein [Clostridia bacterium]|nr:DUF1893 domain-containing protein [Clostridia bacterium]
MITIDDVKNRLRKKEASLVVGYQNDEIKEYYHERIMDLKSILKEDEKALQNSIIADKVIGKVAASIMAVAGVKEIYANVLSKMAIPVLEKAKIKYSYGQMVDFIKNQPQTGMCPMETKYELESDIRKIYQEIMSK